MPWTMEGEGVGQLATTIREQLDRGDAQGRAALLDEYFDPTGGYTGGMFERLGAQAHGPNEIGCHDLLSLNLLDAPATGSAVRILLTNEEVQEKMAGFLAGMGDTDIWEAPDESLDSANELWDLIRDRTTGMGDTRLSKLLARKRPHLIPISDSVIRSAIPLPTGIPDRWVGYRSVFVAEPSLVERLEELRSATSHAGHASLLRIFDVLVWRQRSEPNRSQD